MWKVVLHKEPRSQYILANVYDDCIEAHGKTYSLEAPLEFPNVNSNRTLVGTIELSRQDTLLASQALRINLGTYDA
jgi:hypothetical protein